VRPGHFPRCPDSNDVFGFAVGCIVHEFYEEEQTNFAALYTDHYVHI